ncbi:hypothetical protein V3H18_08770 [Methylocystis sp. 9N]|uniref:Uncharacterized protein n=1 Tax=Methylocystis borbori TaxID=3118750 RepID=A0ABU7XJ99_9HYPH
MRMAEGRGALLAGRRGAGNFYPARGLIATIRAGSEKVDDFFDENLLQYFDFERFLIDHMISM